jgi:hypothetical protein
LFRSTITFTDNQTETYGLPGGTPPEGSRHFKRTFVYAPSQPLQGLWGYQDEETGNLIEAIGAITLDLGNCPLDYVAPEVEPEVEPEEPVVDPTPEEPVVDPEPEVDPVPEVEEEVVDPPVSDDYTDPNAEQPAPGESGLTELEGGVATANEDLEELTIIGFDVLEFSLICAGIVFLLLLVCCGTLCCIRLRQNKKRKQAIADVKPSDREA